MAAPSRNASDLLVSPELLEQLVRRSVLALAVSDLDGNLVAFNEAAERLSGYRAQDVIGRMPAAEFYAPGVLEDILRRVRSENYGGPGRLDPSVSQFIDANGHEVPIMLSSWMLHDDEGNELAVASAFEDLRERIRIEQEVGQARTMMFQRERDEMVRALAGAASHKLNQPLTAVLGLVQILKLHMDGFDEQVIRHIERLEVEAERMAGVLRDLASLDELKLRPYAGSTAIVELGQQGDSVDGNLREGEKVTEE